MIDATHNPRISWQFLEEEKQSLGDWWYLQEYCCQFLDSIDQVFAYDAVMSALSSDVKPLFGIKDGIAITDPLINSAIKPLFGG